MNIEYEKKYFLNAEVYELLNFDSLIKIMEYVFDKDITFLKSKIRTKDNAYIFEDGFCGDNKAMKIFSNLFETDMIILNSNTSNEVVVNRNKILLFFEYSLGEKKIYRLIGLKIDGVIKNIFSKNDIETLNKMLNKNVYINKFLSKILNKKDIKLYDIVNNEKLNYLTESDKMNLIGSIDINMNL